MLNQEKPYIKKKPFYLKHQICIIIFSLFFIVLGKVLSDYKQISN